LALVSFFVQGGTVTFYEITSFADTVEMFGYGTMDWKTRELDLWFSSRSVRPLPVVSRLIENLRNELLTAHVTGVLGEQEISTKVLRGTRALIGRMLGSQRTAQEERLAQIEVRGRENRERVRRAGERVRNLANTEPVRGDTTP
jgi:hypothetical protein